MRIFFITLCFLLIVAGGAAMVYSIAMWSENRIVDWQTWWITLGVGTVAALVGAIASFRLQKD